MAASREIEFGVLDSRDFPGEVERRTREAHDRIGHLTMHGVMDEVFAPVFDAFVDKAPEIDGNMYVGVGALSEVWFDTEEQREANARLRPALQRISEAGGHAELTHPYLPGFFGKLQTALLMFAFQDHRKATVIDNWSASFGGIASTKNATIDRRDCMLTTEDELTADVLFRIIRHGINHNRPGLNSTIRLNDDNWIFLDGGVPGLSRVRKVMFEVLRSAEPGSISWISQLQPFGEMRQILIDNPPLYAIFNSPDRLPGIMGVEQRFANSREPIPNMVIPDDFVHAKIYRAILKPDNKRTLMPEGGPVTMATSYNGTHSHWVSTEEIMLLSRGEKLVADIGEWVAKNLLPKVDMAS